MGVFSTGLLLTLLLSRPVLGGEVLDPNCKECRRAVLESHSAVEGLGAPHVLESRIETRKRIPDILVETKSCPPTKLAMNPDFGLDLRPEVLTETIPAKTIKRQGKYIVIPEKKIPRDVCDVHFSKDCGTHQNVSPIEKLDWMKTNLRATNQLVCNKAVEEFGDRCGPWAGFDADQRKAETMRLVHEAIKDYHPGPTAKFYETNIVKDKKGNEKKVHTRIPLEKSPFLTDNLVQCLLQRENHEFKPNKLNYTECDPKFTNKQTPGDDVVDPKKKKPLPSTANGLFQLLESTVKDLTDRGVLGNYCWQFAEYWQKILPEKTNPALKNADLYPKPKTCRDKFGHDLVQNMSGYPEFQVTTGVATLNEFLEEASHDPKLKSKSHDEIVRWALDHLWFTTKNPQDSKSVLDCEKCLKANGAKCR